MGAPELADERKALRAEGRSIRRSLRAAERANAEHALAGHLGALAIAPGHGVGVYVSDDGEPRLDGFVAELWKRGHPVALPVPAPGVDDFTMEFRPWHEGDVLEPGRFAIPCPPARPAVVPDVLLVPLVRFDAAGNRMGRGAGFYDRWLAEHGAIAIGTAFEAQRAHSLPVQAHDMPMRAVVTELGIRFVRPTGEK